MHTRLTLQPHQRGAKQLLAKYGDRLVGVRYRYDTQQKKRLKTVELVVEERPWAPDTEQKLERTLGGYSGRRRGAGNPATSQRSGRKMEPATWGMGTHIPASGGVAFREANSWDSEKHIDVDAAREGRCIYI